MVNITLFGYPYANKTIDGSSYGDTALSTHQCWSVVHSRTKPKCLACSLIPRPSHVFQCFLGTRLSSLHIFASLPSGLCKQTLKKASILD